MGNCGGSMSPDEKKAKKRSEDIDKQLNLDRKKMKEEVKLLLLGPGESGKSTIFKQMRIISQMGGFTKEELESYRMAVYGNVITQMKVIINAAKQLGFEISTDENKARAERLAALPADLDSLSQDVARDIDALWHDPGIQEAYENRNRYQLNDSADYFFENVHRIAEPDYCPTQQDVLRVRIRTSGIEEAEFDFDDISFRMVDVGGQRSERRKWIHCFDCVTAVIFCAALNEYDMVLREDVSMNRMKESLLLFDEICNSPWFTETAFILFLNKVDLFKEKIQKVDLSKTFPNYKGGADLKEAQAFIKARFLEKNLTEHVIYTHFTCAVNTENIEFVFKCVRETILKQVLDNLF